MMDRRTSDPSDDKPERLPEALLARLRALDRRDVRADPGRDAATLSEARAYFEARSAAETDRRARVAASADYPAPDRSAASHAAPGHGAATHAPATHARLPRRRRRIPGRRAALAAAAA